MPMTVKMSDLFFMPDLSHVTARDWAIMAFGWAFIVGSLALLAYWSEKRSGHNHHHDDNKNNKIIRDGSVEVAETIEKRQALEVNGESEKRSSRRA